MLTILSVTVSVVLLVLFLSSLIKIKENFFSFIFFVFFVLSALFLAGWFLYSADKTKHLPGILLKLYRLMDDDSVSGWDILNKVFFGDKEETASGDFLKQLDEDSGTAAVFRIPDTAQGGSVYIVKSDEQSTGLSGKTIKLKPFDGDEVIPPDGYRIFRQDTKLYIACSESVPLLSVSEGEDGVQTCVSVTELKPDKVIGLPGVRLIYEKI